MVDMILENYSKVLESTLRLQQEMLRSWTMQWSPFGTQVPELPKTGTSTSASAAPDACLVGTRMAVESSKQALIRPGRNEPEAWDRTTRAGPGGLAFGGRSVPDGAEAAHLIDRR
jgi:hypothetical protein